MDAMQALRTRRSVRYYTKERVDKELLSDLVDCGRLAATARNEQPWEFVVVTDDAMKKEIADAAPNGKFIAAAAACIVVLSKPADYALEDGSAATQNILLAAHASGLGACWVAGARKPYGGTICEMLGAPSGYTLISLIAVGYPERIGAPQKRSLDELLHWERF